MRGEKGKDKGRWIGDDEFLKNLDICIGNEGESVGRKRGEGKEEEREEEEEEGSPIV